MITFVNENVVSNPYPGMNLAEACGQFALEMEQIVNEAQMDILLAEHAYLYENGVEVVYEAESGEANENGKAFKEKVLGTIKALGKKISEIWGKIVQWCKDRFAEAKAWFGKIGITQKHVDKAKYIMSTYTVDLKAKPLALKGPKYDAFKKDYPDFFGHVEGANWVAGNEFKEEDYYEKKNLEAIDNNLFDVAEKVVFGGEKAVLSDIEARKKDALNRIKALESMVKAKKEADASETMKALKQASKEQTAVATKCSRLYYAYVNDSIAIVRAVFADKTVKKGIAESEAVIKSQKKIDKEAEKAEGKKKTFGDFLKKNKEEK